MPIGDEDDEKAPKLRCSAAAALRFANQLDCSDDELVDEDDDGDQRFDEDDEEDEEDEEDCDHIGMGFSKSAELELPSNGDLSALSAQVMANVAAETECADDDGAAGMPEDQRQLQEEFKKLKKLSDAAHRAKIELQSDLHSTRTHLTLAEQRAETESLKARAAQLEVARLEDIIVGLKQSATSGEGLRSPPSSARGHPTPRDSAAASSQEQQEQQQVVNSSTNSGAGDDGAVFNHRLAELEQLANTRAARIAELEEALRSAADAGSAEARRALPAPQPGSGGATSSGSKGSKPDSAGRPAEKQKTFVAFTSPPSTPATEEPPTTADGPPPLPSPRVTSPDGAPPRPPLDNTSITSNGSAAGGAPPVPHPSSGGTNTHNRRRRRSSVKLSQLPSVAGGSGGGLTLRQRDDAQTTRPDGTPRSLEEVAALLRADNMALGDENKALRELLKALLKDQAASKETLREMVFRAETLESQIRRERDTREANLRAKSGELEKLYSGLLLRKQDDLNAANGRVRALESSVAELQRAVAARNGGLSPTSGGSSSGHRSKHENNRHHNARSSSASVSSPNEKVGAGSPEGDARSAGYSVRVSLSSDSPTTTTTATVHRPATSNASTATSPLGSDAQQRHRAHSSSEGTARSSEGTRS